MELIREALRDKRQTGRRMYSLARRFSGDLHEIYHDGKSLADHSLQEMFNLVKELPYRRDDAPIEIVARPRYIVKMADGGIDCKKKAVMLGAWCQVNGFRAPGQWRFVSVSHRPDKVIHHVFPQIKLQGYWKNIDATYPEYKLFGVKKVTAFEELLP